MSNSPKFGGVHHVLAEDQKHLDNLLSTVMLALKKHDWLATVSETLRKVTDA